MLTFDRPIWLFLLIPAAAATVWIGRRSLSGMAPMGRRVSLTVRLGVLALLVMALADPQWRLRGKGVAVTVILDASRSLPSARQNEAERYLQEARAGATDDDRLGLVTAARDAYVQALPSPLKREGSIDTRTIGATDGTNLEGALRMAMATMPPDQSNRVMIISDGNETIGSLMAAAQAARAAGVPIDVLPVRYSNEREVIVDKLTAPATARLGETVNLRVVMTATRAAEGRLTLTINGEPVDLDPSGPAMGARVTLAPGTNFQVVPVTLPSRAGPVRFEAVFEPTTDASGRTADTIAENNRAMAVTFLTSQGRVLVLSPRPEEAAPLMRILAESKIDAELRRPEGAPSDMSELGSYEGIALVNCSAYDFSQQQQEKLRAYVHDLGGGLVMTGGPDSFGAGGWIGSPLADALPIKLDPPQKRQMPRGALVLVMHSCEMPNGNYWGKRTAEAAIDALSAQDLAGIIEAGWDIGSAAWTHPLSTVGDKSSIRRSVNAMNYGDTQSLHHMLALAYKDLKNVAAGQKHCIVITDADPAPPSAALLQDFVDARISISTVGVFPHTAADLSRLQHIAQVTGGMYHEITQNGQLASLPQIFIKEAQTIKRALIWEGDPFVPAVSFGATEALRGIGAVPAISGYVVAADREGLSQVILRGQENDPVLAQWQHGLGRVVTFTSDIGARWTTAWAAWGQFRAFWEQHVRWAMRPSVSPNLRVTTEQRGETAVVVVEAADDQGERLNFLRWSSRVVQPDLTSLPLELRQTGPGRYEGSFPTTQAGAFTIAMGYEQSRTGPDGKAETLRGSVQAAVTRPFADEYRSLRDNAPLLEQVAKLTGGRVLPEDPRTADLWSRQGLTPPVSLRSIFLLTALLGTGLFLTDVALRRVRVDPRAIARRVKGLFAKSAASAGQQIDALKAARERAQKRVERQRQTAGQRVGETVGLDQGSPGSAGAKFEASESELRAARAAGSFAEQMIPGAAAPGPGAGEGGAAAK
ncbi:MAG: VWA domain-containing protein, partial [Phycisphaerae bacterium]|nr:VWA domain-containing protein [Phycisphaerae bacterium]